MPKPSGPSHASRRSRRQCLLAGAGLMFGALHCSRPALAQAAAPGPAASAASTELAATLRRARQAVVGLRAEAVDGAGSARTLGERRQGSGVVIGNDGLVLTIGYLILETDQVELETSDGRKLPARVVGYDLATGFGLVQALAPMGLSGVPLGRAAALADQDLLIFVNGGEGGGFAPTRLISRRAFSGYWEYHLESALFTSPPWPMHSGAGLFNAQGELLGIGSLVMADAGKVDGAQRPGNMFVPVDLLPPILNELRHLGTTTSSQRAWLGVNCVEVDGAVRVIRVTANGPAAAAGLQPGDHILRIDDQEVKALDALWLALWRGGPAERVVRLDIARGAERQELKLLSIDRMRTLKRAQGI